MGKHRKDNDSSGQNPQPSQQDPRQQGDGQHPDVNNPGGGQRRKPK